MIDNKQHSKTYCSTEKKKDWNKLTKVSVKVIWLVIICENVQRPSSFDHLANDRSQHGIEHQYRPRLCIHRNIVGTQDYQSGDDKICVVDRSQHGIEHQYRPRLCIHRNIVGTQDYQSGDDKICVVDRSHNGIEHQYHPRLCIHRNIVGTQDYQSGDVF